MEDLEASRKLVFFLAEAVESLGKKKEYLRRTFSRYIDKGKLIKPLRGVYVIVPTRHRDMGSWPAEDLVVLVLEKLKINYYACLLTAASYHGASHQHPMTFQIMVDRQLHKNWIFGRVSVDFYFKKT